MRESTSGLYQLEIELTHECNMKCPHCYIETKNTKHNKFIEPSLVYRLIDEANDLDVSDFIFSGGEATLCESGRYFVIGRSLGT